MAKDKSPKLRTVNKSISAFPINEFPKYFLFLFRQELIYFLTSKGKPELEGSEWENIFSNRIGAESKHSNVGLDEAVLGSAAWAAKTVKVVFLNSKQFVTITSFTNWRNVIKKNG